MSVRRLDPVQPPSFSFTPDNLSWAKRAISKFPTGKQASAVIQLLWRAQEQEGWVSRPAIEYVGKMLDMAFIRVLEVATFYTMFHLSPVGRKAHIQVCGTTPCMLRGSEDLMAVCKRKIHEDPHHLNADGTLSWEEVECLGSCVNAPLVQVFSDTYEDLTPASLEKLIDDFAAGKPVKAGPQNGRQFSMALGGASTLSDKSLYDRPRSYTRVEAPPPPPPVAPAAVAPAATPAAAAPAAAAVTPASIVTKPVVVAPTPVAAPVNAPVIARVAKVEVAPTKKAVPAKAAVKKSAETKPAAKKPAAKKSAAKKPAAKKKK
ncbi:MAG: NADH-quinone oxidoreductase subunit NuoE [Aestuariivirga sp.]